MLNKYASNQTLLSPQSMVHNRVLKRKSKKNKAANKTTAILSPRTGKKKKEKSRLRLDPTEDYMTVLHNERGLDAISAMPMKRSASNNSSLVRSPKNKKKLKLIQ